jgi:hypothetical protein
LPTLNTKLTRRTKTRVHRKHERPEDWWKWLRNS